MTEDTVTRVADATEEGPVSSTTIVNEEKETHMTADNATVATRDEKTAAREAQVQALTAGGLDESTASALTALATSWGAKVTVEKKKPGAVTSKKKAPRKVQDVAEVPAAVVVEATPVVDTRSAKQRFLDGIVRGQKVKMTVSAKTEYGAFLKLGPIGGLLHFTCVPGNTDAEKHAFIKALRYRQELEVTVIGKDDVKKQISVTMVAEAKVEFIKSLTVGQLIQGCTVISNRPTGARVGTGLTTAFMHVTQVDGDSREERDANLAAMKPGTKLDVVVTAVDVDKQEVRVSQRLVPLSMFKAGDQATGSIVRHQSGTVVLKLDGGVKGLVPKSKLTGDADETASIVVGGSFTATVESVDYKEALVVLTRKGKR